MPHDQRVNFQEIKAKVSFEQVLGHLGLRDGLERGGEERTGLCPMCKEEGFRVNLTKNTFSCPGCKKRGSVIDFVAAFKGLGIREAGLFLQQILQRIAKEEKKHTSSPRKDTARKKPAPTSAQVQMQEIVKAVEEFVTELKKFAAEAERILAKLTKGGADVPAQNP
jgi:DNA primase